MYELTIIKERAKQLEDGLISEQEFLIELEHMLVKMSVNQHFNGVHELAKQLLKD